MTHLSKEELEATIRLVKQSLRTVQKWLNEETAYVPRMEIAYVCAALEGVLVPEEPNEDLGAVMDHGYMIMPEYK